MQDATEAATKARTETAALLRDAANRIESGQKVPTAAFVQVYWTDQEVTRLRNVSRGFNLLHALGIFRLMQDDLSEEIRGKD